MGKTAIFKRFETGAFRDATAPTIGASCSNITVQLENQDVNLVIWDTAGQDNFRHIIPMYFNYASIIVVVYDVTADESFKDIPQWHELAATRAPKDAKMILVGNKIDLEENRVVAHEEGRDYALNNGFVNFFEVSAKVNINIEILLKEIAYQTISIIEGMTNEINISDRSKQTKGCC